MATLFFEDFSPGLTFEYERPQPVSKDEIVAFASQFDPQPFHLDEEAARRSLLGGLAASGWHTCAILMRMACDGWIDRTASMGAPGVDEVRWARPVRPGDRLRARWTVTDARASKSRPGMGLVGVDTILANAAGDVVVTQRHTQMVSLRDAPAAAPAAPSDPSAASAAAPPEPSEGPGAPLAGWFDEIQIGASRDLGSETFTKEAIVAFARDYDPQRFHLDEEEARNSHFGALAASGWHTAALWMRNAIATRARVNAERAAQGLETPAGGPSPGFTKLRWVRPVHVGDTIRYSARAVEKRVTSKPGWGLVFSENAGVNQRGETVFEFRGSGFTPLRSA